MSAVFIARVLADGCIQNQLRSIKAHIVLLSAKNVDLGHMLHMGGETTAIGH